ncbi:MAG: type IV secretory system conjugative DNA transfer family protein [Rickettsiales bacterium]|jgi:type IV secretion system protein VirD4|nr:type IV secretory system conjugative DNA transfer family protein [Rickettsiales bacterium]
MASTQEQQVAAFRNFMILSILLIASLLFVFWISGVIFIYLTQRPGTIRRIFTYQPKDQVMYLYDTIRRYFIFIKNNLLRLGYNRQNYLVPKFLVSFLVPLGIYAFYFYKYREQIFTFKVFKVGKGGANAHWATVPEMKKAGLMHNGTGMTMGRYKGKLLVVEKTNCQHVLLFAPTGSGKGVGFCLPNLLFWDDSVIVHDVKLENFEITSGYRSKHMKQKCWLWNPADQDGYSHCYNPMDFISREFGKQVDDVMKITKFLLPKEEFWTNEGRALATGIMLALLALDDRPASMGEVLRTLRSDDVAYNLAVILDTKGDMIHPAGYMNLAAYLQKPDKERGSVTSTAASSMDLWANPLVDAATAKSDFNIGTFRTVATSLFVGISPSNVLRLQPLLQIFYQQCASIFTAKMPDKKKESVRVMMMLDEFPTLGKLEEIKSGIAYYRGYWVKLFLIVQDTEQLKGTYEASGMNSFLSNATFRITYAANNMDTAKFVSDMLGKKTSYSVEEGSRPKYLDLNPGSRQVSTKKSESELLKPQEVITMPKDEQIILIEASPPVKCKKVFYFKEEPFKSRAFMKQVDVPKQEPYIPKKKKKEEEGNKDGGGSFVESVKN